MKKNPYDDIEMHAELNVVPLLDLAWNLLIVFIMVVTATVQGINVNLPKASAAIEQHQARDEGRHHRLRRDDLPRHLPRHHGRAGIEAERR